jgi:hypothetical protein
MVNFSGGQAARSVPPVGVVHLTVRSRKLAPMRRYGSRVGDRRRRVSQFRDRQNLPPVRFVAARIDACPSSRSCAVDDA